MAIYSTFFISDPDEVVEGFPDWRLPLPHPVRREVYNRFTKQMSVIKTREPEWHEERSVQPLERIFKVIAVEGDYEDFLERRLPAVVRAAPHWCGKGLTQVELDPLGKACGFESLFEIALYSPPSSGAILQQFRPEFVTFLRSRETDAIENIAKCWADSMSTPEFTHSVTGGRLSDGWTMSDAMRILEPIVALARNSDDGSGMYLLVEV